MSKESRWSIGNRGEDRTCVLDFDDDGFEDNDDKDAYRFLIYGKVVWIPKTMIEGKVDEKENEVTVKEWWAIKEGLV